MQITINRLARITFKEAYLSINKQFTLTIYTSFIKDEVLNIYTTSIEVMDLAHLKEYKKAILLSIRKNSIIKNAQMALLQILSLKILSFITL